MDEILKSYGLEDNYNLEAIGFTSEEDWLRLRTLGIGGSDIGAIMGINKYSSPYQVYKQKVLGYRKDLSDKVAVKKGKDLESLIRNVYVAPYFEEMGYTVKNLSHHMLVNKNFPYLRANLDGIAIKEGGSYKDNIVIEIKFVSEFADVNWNGEDYCGVPASYYAQVQEYMLVTGMRKAYVCALFEKNWKVNFFEIPADAAFQSNLAIYAENFYNISMIHKVPPKLNSEIDKEDIMEKVEENEAKEIKYIPDASLNETVVTYLDVKAKIKEYDSIKKKLESELVDAYTKGHVPSSPLHSVKVSKVISRRLNTMKLKEEKPEIYEQYSEDSESSRITIK